jgi:hypothetical protein
MYKPTAWITLCLALVALPLLAEPAGESTTLPADESEDGPTVEDLSKLADSLRSRFVIVEYHLQYDKGQEPYAGGRIGKQCPNCSRYHGVHLPEYVKQQRPLETAGLLLDKRHVITADLMIHPRFLKAIKVRIDQDTVAAKPARYAREQWAATLELATPADNIDPLSFDASIEPPYLTAWSGTTNTRWFTQLKGLGRTLLKPFDGKTTWRMTPNYCLITGPDGQAVGMSMRGRIPVDDSWKTAPRDWPGVSQADRTALLDQLKSLAGKGIFRTTLKLRSPRKKAGDNPMVRFSGSDEMANQTEIRTLSVLVDQRRVLVLSMLDPKVTARLEQITLHSPQLDEAVTASFTHSLKDYGAIVATLEQPVDALAPLPFSETDILSLQDRFLPAIEMKLRGDQVMRYVQHLRIFSYSLGWKQQVYPEIGLDDDSIFLFDEKLRLAALPLVRRIPKAQRERFSHDEPELTAVTYIRGVLDGLPESADPSNVPLSEKEENRLAWLGIQLQPLNAELARANDVSHLTQNGQTGALVSYVYADSPAAKAGVEAGWVLLRLHVPDQPKPIEVKVSSSDRSFFPRLWSQYDRIPEQVFDRIPRPWPAAENQFTRTLTDLGFGKEFTADFFHDGKVIKKQFTVTQSPPHYDSAEKFKSESIGLTVRNMTYETRQYFRRKGDDPGVIISKVEPGSKASVAGLKPYEIITHVDDKPVMNVEDFEALLTAAGEHRLAVKRWTRGRVVKVAVDETPDGSPASQPASQPTTRPADS